MSWGAGLFKHAAVFKHAVRFFQPWNLNLEKSDFFQNLAMFKVFNSFWSKFVSKYVLKTGVKQVYTIF